MARPEEGRQGLLIPQPAIIAGEISILTSRDLLTRVVKELGPENIYPRIGRAGNMSLAENALQRLEENIVVESIRGSNLIQIKFAHTDRIMAATVVNTLVNLFKEKHLEVFSGEGPEFLEGHLGTVQTRLREAESNLANFRQRNRIFSFEEQRTHLITQKAGLDTSLKAALIQTIELEQRIAFIKSSRWAVDTSPALRTQLETLQQRERELLDKYVEGSRNVQNARQEMQAARESIKRNSEEMRQLELGKAEGELGIAKARTETIKRQLGQTEGEIKALDARSRELQELKREAASNEQNFQTYSRRLEESKTIEEMDRRKMVAISVVEEAIPSPEPQKGKYGKRELIPMGFFGGIAAGLALALLLEFLSPGMTTPLSAERRLGIPVMVAVTKKS